MTFVETPIFTRTIVEILADDEFRLLQVALLLRPESGRVIPGSGGLRKLRWAPNDRGKRGGIRIIYYWDETTETCFLLYAYLKNERDNLSAKQLKILSRLVREELR